MLTKSASSITLMKSASTNSDHFILPQDGPEKTIINSNEEVVLRTTNDDVEKGGSLHIDTDPEEWNEKEHPPPLSQVDRISNIQRESIRASEDRENGSLGHDDDRMSPPAALGVEEEIKQEEEENIQYTHILIPPPGHNFDGIDITTLLPSTDKDNEDETTIEKGGNYFRLRFFGGKTKVVANDTAKDVGVVDSVGGGNSSKTGIKRKSRVCPNVCTICLMEYEPPERVSWSSNKECTHIFHEDCIIHWLVSLGRTKSKMLRFSEEPTEAQLLNYELECPCCRQDFIVSNNITGWDRSRGDENV